MEEIKIILQEDEEILWSRIKRVNLMGFIYTGIIGIFILLLFGLLLIIFAFQDFLLGIIITLSLLIVGIISCGFIIVKTIIKRKRTLGLDYKHLKNYQFYNIITNKQFIKKDYYFIECSDFSDYPKDSIKISDFTIFLDFKFVEKIMVDTFYKKIYFIVENSSISGSDIYLEYSQDEFNRIMKILTNILSFKEIEQRDNYIVYG